MILPGEKLRLCQISPEGDFIEASEMDDLKIILMTDLDGTLLDHNTFDYEPIKTFMRELLDSGVEIIPNSSKTSEELDHFCADFGQRLPYVSENGAALYHSEIFSGEFSSEQSRRLNSQLEVFNDIPEKDLNQTTSE